MVVVEIQVPDVEGAEAVPDKLLLVLEAILNLSNLSLLFLERTVSV